MPRIPQNSAERAIDMLNAGMTMKAVAMNIGCSTRAFRHLRQRFQATGYTEDRPRIGRPDVTTRGQDRNIRITHIASKLPHLLLQTLMIHITTVYLPKLCAITLREGGLSARRPYVGCVLARGHRVNSVNWARKRQRQGSSIP